MEGLGIQEFGKIHLVVEVKSKRTELQMIRRNIAKQEESGESESQSKAVPQKDVLVESKGSGIV